MEQISTKPQTSPDARTKERGCFGVYGHFCASHPWEVIVLMVTLTILCLLPVSVWTEGDNSPSNHRQSGDEVTLWKGCVEFNISIMLEGKHFSDDYHQ